ncbi:hypothetical protein [uncultured Photobacterium sp.]|uniref:hypothetical protein n=1 Tax=uncultured Photobacterium sp. TaxID=173973 RepID=UPI00262A4BC3|nr:hypothetical protein [uncultured Photobacterium sp.]
MSLENLTRFNDEEIKKLKEDIWSAPVVYEWDAIEWGVTEFGMFIFALVSSLIMPLSIAFIADDYSIDLFLFWVLMFFMAYFMYRFLFMPKEKNCYQLTSIGIRYTSKKDIPDFVYTAVRYIAWGGVLLSVFAMAIMGPLALVGAGGFALLAVGFVNYKPSVEYHSVLFKNKVSIKQCKKRNVVSIESIPRHVSYSRNIYTNDDYNIFYRELSEIVVVDKYEEVKSMSDL